jgi:hypothetical protein
MRRFAALTAASSVSNVCVIPSLLFTGTDANPTPPLRCSMMNYFIIVSARRRKMLMDAALSRRDLALRPQPRRRR